MLPTNMGGKGAEKSLYCKGRLLEIQYTEVDKCELCVGLIHKQGKCCERKLCVLIRLMV